MRFIARIKESTYFQSHNPTCIDNFLTNQKAMFKLSRLFETDLSDHHKLISVAIKSVVFRGQFTDLTKNLTWNILILH